MSRCLKCGRCCSSIGIWLGDTEIDEDLLTWHLHHGAEIMFASKSHMYGVEYSIKCKHLATNNLCAIYTNRPLICRGEEFNIPLALSGCVRGEIKRYANIVSLKEVF